MKKFELGNGHEISIEKANRGLEDDYKIVYYEDGRKIFEEYGNADYISYEYEINI